MLRNTLVMIIMLLLAACQTATPTPQPVASTPPVDLNMAFQGLPTPVSQEIIDLADAEYMVLTNIYERVAPSVVNIEVISVETGSAFSDVGRGSGVVYDTAGHIITNAHVIAGARTIQVTFNNGYIAEADVVGTDPYSDLAVLRIDVDESRLLPVAFSNSDTVRVGQRAIAIGNPFGLASSMTLGIVSGLGRQLPSSSLLGMELTSFSNPSIIQVDTDINPGNSGGPLLNSRGELIGINVAIRSDTGIFQGVGFAIPANTVRRVVPELILNGRVNYAWIGIAAPPEDSGFSVPALAEQLNLPVQAGVLITSVTADSPAQKAGLRGGSQLVEVRGVTICAGGDIIVAVNNTYVRNIDELLAYLVVNSSPGDEVNMLVVRGNETFEIPLTLEARPTTSIGESLDDCQG